MSSCVAEIEADLLNFRNGSTSEVRGTWKARLLYPRQQTI